jgi:hypothetical protein
MEWNVIFLVSVCVQKAEDWNGQVKLGTPQFLGELESHIIGTHG